MKRLAFAKPVTRRLTPESNDYTNPNTNPTRPSRHLTGPGGDHREEITEANLRGEITGFNIRGKSLGGGITGGVHREITWGITCLLCYVMLCYMDISIAPLAEIYSEALSA